MLRFKLKELIAEKEFQEGRRVTVAEISEETGIARNTLSRILNQPGWSTRTEYLDRLCAYFDCKVDELVEYIRDRPSGENPESSAER